MSRFSSATFDFPGALKPSKSSHALIAPSSENSRDSSQYNGLSSINLAPAYRPFGDSDQCETHISEEALPVNTPIVSNSLLNRQASNSLLSKYSLLQQQDNTESNSSNHLQLSQLSDSQILQQLQKRSAFRNVKDSLVFYGTNKPKSNINKTDLSQKSEDVQGTQQLQNSDKQGNIIKSPNERLKDRVDRSQESNTRDEITQFRATDCVGLSTGRSQSLLSAELSPWRQRISENLIQASINNANNGILNKQNELKQPDSSSNEAAPQPQQTQLLQKQSLAQQNQLQIDQNTQLIQEKSNKPIDQERISSPKGLIQFQNKQFLLGTAKSQDSHEQENETLTPDDLLMNTQEFSRFQEVQLQLNHTQQQANINNIPLNQQANLSKVHSPQNNNNPYEININEQLNLKAYSMYSKNEIDINNNKSNVYLNSTVSFANLNKDVHDNTLNSPAASFSMLSPQFAQTQLNQLLQLEKSSLSQDIPNMQLKQIEEQKKHQQQQLNLSSLPQPDHLQNNQENNPLSVYSSQQKKNLTAKTIPQTSQNERKINKLLQHFSSAQLHQKQTLNSSVRNPYSSSSVQSSCNNQPTTNNEKSGFNYFLSPFSNLNSIKESSKLLRQRSTSNISEINKQGKEHGLFQKASPQSNVIQPAKLKRSSSFINQLKQPSNASNQENQGVIQNKNNLNVDAIYNSKKEESVVLREQAFSNNNSSILSSVINQADSLTKAKQVSSCQYNNQSQQSSLFVSIETSKAQLFAEEIFNLLPENNRDRIDFQTLLLIMIDTGLISLASFSKNKNISINSGQISHGNQEYFDETQIITTAEIEKKLFFAIWTLLGGRNTQQISVNDLIQLLITILNIPQSSNGFSEIKSQLSQKYPSYNNNTKQRSISPTLTKSRSISSLSQHSNPSPFSRKRTSKVVETFSALLKTTSKLAAPQQLNQQKQQHQIEIEPILKEYASFIQNAPESFLQSFASDKRLWIGNEDEKALLRQAFELLSRNRTVFEQSCYNSNNEKQVNNSLNSTTVVSKKQSTSSIFHQGSQFSSIEGKENNNSQQTLNKQIQSNRDPNKRNKNEINSYEPYENRFEKKYSGGIYGKNVNKLIDRMRNTRIEREILQEPPQLTKRNIQQNPSITAETDRFINSQDASVAISSSNVQLKQQHKDISQQHVLNEMHSRKQSTVVIGNSAESISYINNFQRM